LVSILYIKNTDAMECLTRKKSVKYHTIEKFLISKYHYFECKSDQYGIIETSEYIDGITSYHFKLRKYNIIQMTLLESLVYRISLPIIHSKMKDLKQLIKYIP
jgi:hypothetical protein